MKFRTWSKGECMVLLAGFFAGGIICWLAICLKRSINSAEKKIALNVHECKCPEGNLSDHKPFGYSLLLDLYGCEKSLCDDMNDSYEFLNKLVAFLKMNKQSEPTLVRTDHDRFPDKRGLSGWVPLVESGIQIHTLTVKNFITIDIYSCREFDREQVRDYVKDWFKAKDVEEHFILRGTRYHNIKSTD